MNINAFIDLNYQLIYGLGGGWERMHYGNEDAGMLAIYLKRLWEMLTVSSTPSGYCAHWLHKIKLGAHLEKEETHTFG